MSTQTDSGVPAAPSDSSLKPCGHAAIPNAHTAGPWAVHERQVLEDASVYPMHITGGSAGFQVCLMEGPNVARLLQFDEAWKQSAANGFTDANARLIAAAPELLEALQHLVGMLKTAGYATGHADAAIAKATGSQP